MPRLSNKISFSSRVLYLLIIICILTTQLSLKKSKEAFYKELEHLCYPNELFKYVYKQYSNSNKTFYWLDFFVNKENDKYDYVYKSGSTYLYKSKTIKSAYAEYSLTQAIEFYQNMFDSHGYKLGINTEKTYIHNDESRDYLPFLDGCTLTYGGMFFNKLTYVKDKLNIIDKSVWGMNTDSEHVDTLFRILYQVGRGILYLLQNNHYSNQISYDNVKFYEVRNFKVFKLSKPLSVRYHCDPTYFPEYMTKDFEKLYKKIEDKTIPEEIERIQDSLNFCGNVNVKQFVILFEQISKQFPVKKESFSWRSCFNIDTVDGFCSDKFKEIMKSNSRQTYNLIRILNGKHYNTLNPESLMVSILELVGTYLDSSFDKSNIIGQYGSELIRTERYN
jgi:hypothetical protein